MTDRLTAQSGLDELRRKELARREARRLARDRGDLPSLTARHRVDQGASTTPVGTGRVQDVAPLSPRVRILIARILADYPEGGAFARALRRALAPPLEPGSIVQALSHHVAASDPLAALAHVVDLTRAGLPLLDDGCLTGADLLLKAETPTTFPPSPDDWPAWQLHLAAEAARTGRALPAEAWPQLARQLPLAVVDDLIDQGRLNAPLPPHIWSASDERMNYVLARVSPGQLDDGEIESLGWTDERDRRALLSGSRLIPVAGRHNQWTLRSSLLHGDVAALDEVEAAVLPRDLRALVEALRGVRRGADIPAAWAHDRGTYALFEQCLPQNHVVSGRTPFHHWAGVRRLYRLLNEAHLALAAAPAPAPPLWPRVVAQAQALRDQGSGPAAGRADREARAVLAYVYFLTARSGDRDRLDRAIGLLADIANAGSGRRPGASREGHRRLVRMVDLLHDLRQRGKPYAVLNPYLALGAEHECSSATWRDHWRELRRDVPSARLEYINQAKDRIQRREMATRKKESVEALYGLPLDPRLTQLPRDRTPTLMPAASVLIRRTSSSTETERRWSRTEAARELMERHCAMTGALKE